MRKNILIITPKTYNGGAERVASRISRYYSQITNTYVISFDSKRIDFKFGGNLEEIKVIINGNIIKNIKSIIIAIKKVKKFKKENKIDVSISLTGLPNIINILSKSEEKVCVSVRTYVRKQKTLLKIIQYKIIYKIIYKYADEIISVSQGVKNDLVESYKIKKDKIKVIYPYIEVNEVQKMCNEQIETKYNDIFSKPVIINVARLTYDKGQWQLIRAFEYVKKKNPLTKLVFIGTGDLEDLLKNLASKSKYSQDIHFLGYKKNPFKYIKASCVMAFPSIIEGFGNSICESMACGTAVISSDCKYGPREIIAPDSNLNSSITSEEIHEAGILIPVGDGIVILSEEKLKHEELILSKTLNKVLKNNDVRIRLQNGALERSKYFDKKNIVKAWKEIITYICMAALLASIDSRMISV